MQQTQQKKFEVAIVGGGICGLTLAVALQKAGVSVQLFEAAAAFGEVGAGIGLGPNAITVLKGLDVWDEVMKKCTPVDLQHQRFIFRTGVGEHKVVYKYPAELPKDEGLGIHRATLLDALIGLVDHAACHFHKRCVSVVESPSNPKRILLSFLDGTTHEADVVLGADGIKSAGREFLVGHENNIAAFSNTVVYRGLIPYADLKAAGFKIDLTDHPTCIVGPNKHFIIFPIKHAEIINVVAFDAKYDLAIGAADVDEGTAWVADSTREELKMAYEGWGPDVQILLDCMPEKPSKWYIHVVHPSLESYSKGRVALLGDAAHGMLPHLGAGAGQGLEDVYMLARLLRHPDTNVNNLETVLQVYSDFRRPRAQMVWDGSRFAGRVYDGTGPHGEDFEKIGEDLSPERLYHPIWRHDFDAEFERVLTTLRERDAFPAVSK